MSQPPLQNHLEDSNPVSAWAAGSWLHVEEPSRVGIFPDTPSAKNLVKDSRGGRARREEGREREPELCGWELSRLRLGQKGPVCRSSLLGAPRLAQATVRECAPGARGCTGLGFPVGSQQGTALQPSRDAFLAGCQGPTATACGHCLWALPQAQVSPVPQRGTEGAL